MRRILVALLCLLSFPAWAQIPGGSDIQIGNTPVVGGTANLCLYVTTANKVGQQGCAGLSSITIGTSTITSGTSGRVLYDNAGVVGEMTNTGTGTVNVLQNTPTLTTPVIGAATGTSLAVTATLATGAPAGSSAGLWKLGALQAGAVVVDTTRSVFIDIGGVVYKLIVAQ